MLVVVLPTESPAIHLDMILTVVDREQCVIYPPYFVGPSRLPILHYRPSTSAIREHPDLQAALREVGLPLSPIHCGGDHPTFQEREQWASGCNFVALRPGLVVGYSRNEATMRAMESTGGYRIVDAIDFVAGDVDIEDDEKVVVALDSSELVRGGGGGRCMTLPVLREDIW